MINSIPTVSFWDSLFYNIVHIVPYYLQGIFTRNRFWVTIWTKLHPDPLGIKFVNRLQRKYNSPYFYIYLLTTKSLWVLDHDSIKHILDRSPSIYAEAALKRNGMSHFQPGAVTITRGKTWEERRRFNEAVLDSGQCLHRYADSFSRLLGNV